MYGLISEDYLMHHGVKGMKWGVRRQKFREAVGYGHASRFQERRSIKNLKKQKKQSGMSNDSFKSKKASIERKSAASRGKKLVEANQNYGKTLAKGLISTSAVATAGFFMGPLAWAPMGAAAAYNAKNMVQRTKDIHAYRKYGRK